MGKLFKGKYRGKTARRPNWDYRTQAAYFITICTGNRECYFGEIDDGKMRLSKVGVIADILWHEIKNHSRNVELDEYVVMPNHVHGILFLNGNDTGDCKSNEIVNNSIDTVNVGTLHATSLPSNKNESMSKISPKSGSVSSIIRSYKSAVTNHSRRLGFEFSWQSRFHDHIIRNNESLERIRKYIRNNPTNWHTDKFFNVIDKRNNSRRQ